MSAVPFPGATVGRVVPTGYKWTPEMMKDAQSKYAYILVGPNRTNSNKRVLSGADRKWKGKDARDQGAIYLLDYRITGQPQDVAQALRFAGVPEANIAASIAQAVTQANWASPEVQAYVAQETAARKATKKAKKPAESYNHDQIVWFAKNVRSEGTQVVTKEGVKVAGAAKKAGGGGGKGRKSLGQRLSELKPGEVLDVSDWNAATGIGAHKRAVPKTDTSGKFYAGNIPITSNNLPAYEQALVAAYGAAALTQYAAAVEELRQKLQAKAGSLVAAPLTQFIVPAAVPALGRAPSPPRLAVAPIVPVVPGASLAPVPVFAAVPAVASPPRAVVPAALPAIPTLGGAGFAPIAPLRI